MPSIDKDSLNQLPSLFLIVLSFCIILLVGAGCERQTDSLLLYDLIDETEAFLDEEDPFRGGEDDRYLENDKLRDESLESSENRYRFWVDIRNRFSEYISRESLELRDQITYDSFARQINHNVRQYEFSDHLIPLNHEDGFYNQLNGLENRVPLDSLADYENYLSRLRAVPEFFNQHIDRMRQGVESFHTAPKVIFTDDYSHAIESQIAADPEESDFFTPFTDFPSSIGDAEREWLVAEAREVISGIVMPAYSGFLDFLHEEYIPNARESIGTSALPGGDDYYSYLIEYHTTLSMTAGEVHQVGLDEVDRILEEMNGIIGEVGFEGTFPEFLEFLRTDPQFYVTEPVDLIREASWLAKRMDGKLPELFHLHNLPRRPYGVEPVPDHLAPRYTGGRYAGGSEDESSFFWVNTFALESRPLYTLEALAYHEAVPGHHLQIALSREMEDLPKLMGGLTAYTEGWALYAERLGLDVELYENPYYNFGRLTYEMWRACRLVVDTGMHALGWSRQEAVDFLTGHTALSHHEIDTEINRYIAVPGQALAYKMGELKIRELRELAEERLGDAFDIRDFHEWILQNGPVTLPVLEEQVQNAIDHQLSVM